MNSRRRLLLIFVPVAVVVLVFAWVYLTGDRYQSTDDAFLQAAQVSIAANVSGQVVSIEVEENQAIQAGKVLFRIDPRTFQTAVDEAQAQLESARSYVRAMHVNYHQAQFDEADLAVRTTQQSPQRWWLTWIRSGLC